MALLKNAFRRLRFWKRTNTDSLSCSESDIDYGLKKYEFAIYKLERIVLWEKPSETLGALAVLNFFFWLMVNLEWRFYRIVFSVLLLVTVHELWTKQIWPEIRVREPLPETRNPVSEAKARECLIRSKYIVDVGQKMIKDYYFWLKNLREEKPGMFCFMMSAMFLSLSYIGRLFPGLILMYTTIMLCMLGPGFWVHVLSEKTKKSIRERWASVHQAVCQSEGDILSEDDFIPEITKEDLVLLSQVAEPDCYTDGQESRASSETHLSLATGISMIPAHDENSVDSLATFSEMDLNIDVSQRPIPDIEELSDDSIASDIDFQATHFNGDDSSTDTDNEFTKGLTFTETDSSSRTASVPSSTTTEQPSVGSFLSSNLIGLGVLPYLTNALNRGIANAQRSDRGEPKRITKNFSSDSLISDEDFEMISHEDIS